MVKSLLHHPAFATLSGTHVTEPTFVRLTHLRFSVLEWWVLCFCLLTWRWPNLFSNCQLFYLPGVLIGSKPSYCDLSINCSVKNRGSNFWKVLIQQPGRFFIKCTIITDNDWVYLLYRVYCMLVDVLVLLFFEPSFHVFFVSYIWHIKQNSVSMNVTFQIRLHITFIFIIVFHADYLGLFFSTDLFN